jgi:hypothetical protein
MHSRNTCMCMHRDHTIKHFCAGGPVLYRPLAVRVYFVNYPEFIKIVALPIERASLRRHKTKPMLAILCLSLVQFLCSVVQNVLQMRDSHARLRYAGHRYIYFVCIPGKFPRDAVKEAGIYSEIRYLIMY